MKVRFFPSLPKEKVVFVLYRYIRTHRLLQKKRIIYVMGGCCALCGYDKCSDAMELHHIDPTKKTLHLAKNFFVETGINMFYQN